MVDSAIAAPKIGAFFDLDRTILRDSSGRLYLRYLRARGYLSWVQWGVILGQILLYIIGIWDFPHIIGRLTMRVAGGREADAWRLSTAWFEAMLRDYIAPAAAERVAWHLGQGHHVAVISASTPYAVRPVAQALGLGDAFVATELEVRDGIFTGRLVLPTCYGPGKLTRARTYAERHGLDLGQSFFYSDSYHDLPLLSAVGRPVAVNPDRRLKRIAQQRSWPVLYFY